MSKRKNKIVAVDLLEQYRSTVAADPQSAAAHTDLGWGYYGRDQWVEAIEAFKQALQLDDQRLEALYGLGLALKANGAKTEAVAALEKTLPLVSALPDPAQQQMLKRLIAGHLNIIKTGAWNLPPA